MRGGKNDAIAGIIQITRSVGHNIIDLAATMVNYTVQVWSRQARFLASVLVGAAVASNFQPTLQEEGCKTLSVSGSYKDDKAKLM